MPPRTNLALALAAAITFAALPARADSAPPAPQQPPPKEIAIPTFQIMSGVAIQLGGLTGFVLLSDQVEGGVGIGLALATLLATPALEGLAICGIGKLSSRYTGVCGAPIVAAYIGIVASVGIYLGAHELLGGNDTLGFAAFALGAPVLATYVWHSRKIPRAEARAALAPPLIIDRSAFAPRSARERSDPGPATMLPIFITRF